MGPYATRLGCPSAVPPVVVCGGLSEDVRGLWEVRPEPPSATLYRLLQSVVALRAFPGALFGSDRYVYQRVAGAQALRRLLAQARLLPTLSRRNHDVLTETATSAF